MFGSENPQYLSDPFRFATDQDGERAFQRTLNLQALGYGFTVGVNERFPIPIVMDLGTPSSLFLKTLI